MNTEQQMTPEQLRIQSLEAHIVWLKDNDTKIEHKNKFLNTYWILSTEPLWDHGMFYYRIAQPKKEKKLKIVPLEMSDFDGVATVWLSYGGSDYHKFAVAIEPTGIRCGEYRSFQELCDCEWMYSFDRKNWKRCYKEIEV